jgi:hypothetical protein
LIVRTVRSEDLAVPIPINQSEAEIGAAQTTILEKKRKVRAGIEGNIIPGRRGRDKILTGLLTVRRMKNLAAWWPKMSRNFLPVPLLIPRRVSGLKTVRRK